MAKEEQMKHINLVAPVDEVCPPLEKAQDYMGIPLELHGFERRRGGLSDFFILECVNPETGLEVHITTGSYMIFNQLKVMSPARDCPLLFALMVRGRSYYMGWPAA